MTPRLPRAGCGWLVAAAAWALSACSGVPQWEKPGAARSDVVARLGTPTAVYPLPGGERLQYSQQPAGRQVHNLDFDAGARLVAVEQVMDPAVFARIGVGRWTRNDLLRQFGPPARIERVARWDGDIWTWRYLEAGSVFRQLHVHLDPAGVVRQVMSTDEPLPDDRTP